MKHFFPLLRLLPLAAILLSFNVLHAQVVWQRVSSGLPNDSIMAVAADSAGRVFALVPSMKPHPHFPDRPFAVLYRSTDLGGSWNWVADSMATRPMVSTLTGIFVAAESSTFWSYDRSDHYDKAAPWRFTSDGGSTWKWIPSDGVGTGLSSNNYGVIAAGWAQLNSFDYGSAGGSISISTDYGRNWSGNSIPNGAAVRAVMVTASGEILAGTYNEGDAGLYFPGLFRSADSGKSWQLLNDTMGVYELGENNRGEIFATAVRAYEIIPPGYDYHVATIYRSTDRGVSWLPLLDSIYRPQKLSISPYGNILVEGIIQTVRSSDNGTSWTRLVVDSSYSPLSNITFVPHALAYATAGGGVYRSTDDGETWQDISSNLPHRNVRSLAFSPTGYLFAGTAGDGIFRLAVTASVSEQPSMRSTELSLEAITPNPITSNATVGFSLPHSEHISLKLRDLLGREVATLASGPMPAGRTEVKLDAAGLASGTYLVTLASADSVASRVIVVAR
jgi:hypothetical protein